MQFPEALLEGGPWEIPLSSRGWQLCVTAVLIPLLYPEGGSPYPDSFFFFFAGVERAEMVSGKNRSQGRERAKGQRKQMRISEAIDLSQT
jgi:hypothetical protein